MEGDWDGVGGMGWDGWRIWNEYIGSVGDGLGWSSRVESKDIAKKDDFDSQASIRLPHSAANSGSILRPSSLSIL